MHKKIIFFIFSAFGGIILSGDFTMDNGLLTTNRDMSNLEIIEKQRKLDSHLPHDLTEKGQ
jgi:hypothetical protein